MSMRPMTGLRILLADDHDVVRRGLRQLLEQQPDWVVCGEAVTGGQAVEMARELEPNIVVMDLTMPGLSGLEATRQIRKAQPSVEILIFTMHESEQLIRDVLGAGARGYLLKSEAAAQIISAVETVGRHKPYFNTKVSETIVGAFLRGSREITSPPDPLTPREREIVQLLAESKSNRQIATLLGITLKTVETHRASAMRKLDLHSVVDLVRYALRNNLTSV